MMTQYTQAQSLLRQGNPACLVSQILGVSTVTGLANQAGILAQDVNAMRQMVNPQGYNASMGTIFSSYALPAWNGSTSVTPLQGSYQFATSQYSVSSQIQTLITECEQQKMTLENEIAQDTVAMNSATDQLTVAKYHAAITALQTALGELQAREQQLKSQSQLIGQQM
jgi:hypothetical protein